MVAGIYYKKIGAGIGRIHRLRVERIRLRLSRRLADDRSDLRGCLSYAYVNRQDPFTSRAALTEVTFEESRMEQFQRRMANLGNGIRATVRALARNKAGLVGFFGILFFFVVLTFGPLFIAYDGQAHTRPARAGGTGAGRLRQVQSFRSAWTGKGAMCCRTWSTAGKS